MRRAIIRALEEIFTVRWRPSQDLGAVTASWFLVVGAVYAANVIVGPSVAGGMAYFALYAVLGAALFGVGIPLYWMVVFRQRTLADLGLTTRHWTLSVVFQLVLALFEYSSTLAGAELPSLGRLVPLIALALTVGFFEAVFWRGWVQLRLEESFGIVPGILLGSALYAAYHVGYGMPLREIAFLFVVGIVFALAFRLTRSVLILWPLFQPMGQLVTLIRDNLTLPPLAALGFVEALILMLALVWLAGRYHRKRHEQEASGPVHASAA
jgi:membrane protease YdiL (CAAX protease family)